MNRLYRTHLAGKQEREFLDAALQLFQIKYKISREDLEKIPIQGPVILMANHPFGIQDAFLMAWILQEVRPDYKILSHSYFSHFDEITHRIIALDPAAKGNENNRGLEEALAHLQSGGILGVFPAGSASHLRWDKKRIADGEWSDIVSRLVHSCKADVVPVHFTGRNSYAYQIAGLIHPVIRTAMLPSESLKRKKRVVARVGRVIPHPYLMKFEDSKTMTSYLRMRCYLLKERKALFSIPKQKRLMETVRAPQSVEVLERELQSLPRNCCLLTHKEFSVYCCAAPQIPRLLEEIGRLREITFRSAAEGTGRSIDLDEYDQTYLHIFIWNDSTREVVGAYRCGQVDVLLEKYGVNGLYTSNFYQYTTDFLAKHRHGLEMGRSFVREEYQKKSNALLLLWKGISIYVARHPHYRYLLGAVSVSNAYDPKSRGMIAALLQEKDALKSKMPATIRLNKEIREFCRSYRIRDVEDLRVLVKSIEKDGKDVPVLVRHYMKLGAKFYGFCVDKDFGGTLDGLIVVDYPYAPREYLKLYMGDGWEAYFLRYFNTPEP